MATLATADVQIELSRHALGLDGRKRQSYRNRFVVGPGSNDHAVWMAMVKAGDATRRDGATIPFGGDDLFYLTEQGARKALQGREKLDPEDFPGSELAAVAKKLSPSQRLLLTNLRDGEHPKAGIHGRSAHGGFEGTIRWAFRNEYVEDHGDFEWRLTEQGRKLLARLES